MTSLTPTASESRRIVEEALQTCLAEWRGHKSFAWAGECGIFADYVYFAAKQNGLELQLDSFDNGFTSDSSVAAPPGTTLAELEALGVAEGLNHVWLVHAGRHYDAAHPCGVEDPSDLTAFKLGLVYMLQRLAPGKLTQLCAEHPWWQAALQAADAFSLVHAVRDTDYQPN